MRTLFTKALLLCSFLFTSTVSLADLSPMEEKKIKRAAEEAITETLSEIKAKNEALSITFDWAAYDGLDWAGMSKARSEEIIYLKGHFTSFGAGFNAACEDADYKEELVKVKNIVLKPASGESPGNKANGALEGDTLTITFDSLGGTLGSSDWEKGIKSAY
jgi:hypothetical protein